MLDFRAILKSKVPNLANLDQPSFERIYQTFQEQVGKHGLGDIESFYNTARTSGDQALQAMQERVAEQAAVGSGATSGPQSRGGAPRAATPAPTVAGPMAQAPTAPVRSPEARRTGLGTGTASNFSPEAQRGGMGAGTVGSAYASPELARAQGAQPPPAGPSDPALRGGAGPVASPEALRTGMGSGTAASTTADRNLLAMAEQRGAGTVSNYASPEAARMQPQDTFSPEAGRAGVSGGTASNFSPEAGRAGVGAGAVGSIYASPEAARMQPPNTFSPEAARAQGAQPMTLDRPRPPAVDPAMRGGQVPHPAFEGGTAAARPMPTGQGSPHLQNPSSPAPQSGWTPTTPAVDPATRGQDTQAIMEWLDTEGARNLLHPNGWQGNTGFGNQPLPAGGAGAGGDGGMPPAGGDGAGQHQLLPIDAGAGGGAGGGAGAGGGGGAGGGVPATTGFATPTDLTGQINTAYDTLEQTTRDEFGALQTQDFSDQIRALVESGRVSLNELNAQQLATLQESEARRIGQIGDIQGQLQGDLGQQEQYRQDIQRQVAEQAATRAGQMTADQAARIEAARGALGGQVTSEFEEVAALTGGLTGSQALSTTAGMDRLAQVANQGAAQRLSAPATLAAEAKMAVGDEKFRLENQLAQSLSEGMAELNMQEQQQVMQEAMRQEQFGIERDQALAQALTNIAGQRASGTLNEAGRLEDIAQRQGEITQGQGYQAAAALADRTWRGQQAADQRTWQGGQAAADRTWRGQQALDERDWRTQEGIDERAWRQQEGVDEREWRDQQGIDEREWRQQEGIDERQWRREEAETAATARLEEFTSTEARLRDDASDAATAELEAASPTSALGQLNKDFAGVDDGLKMIAFSLSFMSKEDQETAMARYSQPGAAGVGSTGSKALSQKEIGQIESMIGYLIPKLSEDVGLERAVPNDPAGIDYRVEQQNRPTYASEYSYLAPLHSPELFDPATGRYIGNDPPPASVSRRAR